MSWPSRDRLASNSAISGIGSNPVDLSSFSDFLRRQAPDLLPAGSNPADGVARGGAADAGGAGQLPHGTTVVALKYP
ncbi:MAG: proteasome subunit beta, partial [Mycobacterium sp.]